MPQAVGWSGACSDLKSPALETELDALDAGALRGYVGDLRTKAFADLGRQDLAALRAVETKIEKLEKLERGGGWSSGTQVKTLKEEIERDINALLKNLDRGNAGAGKGCADPVGGVRGTGNKGGMTQAEKNIVYSATQSKVDSLQALRQVALSRGVPASELRSVDATIAKGKSLMADVGKNEATQVGSAIYQTRAQHALNDLIAQVMRMASKQKNDGSEMCGGEGGEGAAAANFGGGGSGGGAPTLRALAIVLGDLLNKQAEVAQKAAQGLDGESTQGEVLQATAEAAVLAFMATQFAGAVQNVADSFKAVGQKA